MQKKEPEDNVFALALEAFIEGYSIVLKAVTWIFNFLKKSLETR